MAKNISFNENVLVYSFIDISSDELSNNNIKMTPMIKSGYIPKSILKIDGSLNNNTTETLIPRQRDQHRLTFLSKFNSMKLLISSCFIGLFALILFGVSIYYFINL